MTKPKRKPPQPVRRAERPKAERVNEAPSVDLYKPAARCPECGISPPVRFTAADVRRAARDRQSARIQTTQCGRCGTRYWIRASDIATATLDTPAAAA